MAEGRVKRRHLRSGWQPAESDALYREPPPLGAPSAPPHRHGSLAQGDQIEAEELAAFEATISAFADSSQFTMIDTPSIDNYLMRAAHLMADTLLTPLQDSVLDLCPLGLTDPVNHEMTQTGHYVAIVCETRKKRRQLDPAFLDWVVVPNRYSEDGLVKRSFCAFCQPTIGALPNWA